MIEFLKKLFGLTPAAPQVNETPAPYKVETPAPVEAAPQPRKCGCGRSPTGNCVGLHALTDSEWKVHAANPNKEVAAPAKKPRAKPAAKPKAAPKKEAAAPAPAPRKPRKKS